jgi:phenylacetate-CoA ligase
VPFWSERFRDANVRPETIGAVDDLRRLPWLTKRELRSLAPFDLVPPASRHRLYLCRSTSGTTGSPTSVFWTRADWLALIETMARALGDHRPDGELIAFNGYHLGHAAGRGYEDVVRLLGGTSVPRHYLADDEVATLEQLGAFGCNTLILTQRSGLKKSGRAVEDLLRHDGDFFARYGIRWWLGSSSTFTAEVRETAVRQGVRAVTNLYGSSEFGTLAVSCRARPEEFHLAFGHVFVEVVGADGVAVSSGERGRIVVSHLLASHPDGGRGPREGSQLLRLDNGDEATFFAGECACGLTTPRIRDVRRGES